MAKKPETVFKERIFPKIKAIPNSWFEKIQQVGKRGTPDFLGCIDGLFVAIELKKDLAELNAENSTSKLQDYKMSKIREAKGITLKTCPETWEEDYKFLLSIRRDNEDQKKRVTSRVIKRTK